MVRIQSDIRRLWRCPGCQYERRAHATQTAVKCHCQQDAPFMQLVETQRSARPVPDKLPPYFEFLEEEPETVEELLQPVTQSEEEIGETAPPVEVSEAQSAETADDQPESTTED